MFSVVTVGRNLPSVSFYRVFVRQFFEIAAYFSDSQFDWHTQLLMRRQSRSAITEHATGLSKPRIACPVTRRWVVQRAKQEHLFVEWYYLNHENVIWLLLQLVQFYFVHIWGKSKVLQWAVFDDIQKKIPRNKYSGKKTIGSDIEFSLQPK